MTSCDNVNDIYHIFSEKTRFTLFTGFSPADVERLGSSRLFWGFFESCELIPLILIKTSAY